METYKDYGIDIPYRRTHGNVKCVCPNCKDTRSHPMDRSLSVNLDKGVWLCHHCGWSGGLKNYNGSVAYFKPRHEYTKPKLINCTTPRERLLQWLLKRGISQSTVDALGIQEGITYMPQAEKEMNTIQFPYYLNGELINIKYRTANKFFKLESGAELIPYNIDAIADTPECIITEGEMDCLSFIEVGRKDCISVPNGANANLSYLDDFMEGWFDTKETIYIASDSDTKGLVLRDELIRRFGAERCKIVTYGDGCKDANEHLIKYGKESLMRCVTYAKEVDIPGIYTESDYDAELNDVFNGKRRELISIGWQNFDEICHLEQKRLMIVTGIPSSGKSAWLNEVCVRLNIYHGWKIAFFSPESLPFAYHAANIIELLMGKKMDSQSMTADEFYQAKVYLSENFFHILPGDGYTTDSILDKTKILVRRKGVKVLVIDPYNMIEDNIGNKETDYVSKLLSKLKNFAIQNNMLVVLMAHPQKIKRNDYTDGIPDMYSISGSAHFYNKADYGIIIHRNREEKYTLVRVAKVKLKELGLGGDCKFVYDIECGRYNPMIEGIPCTFDRRPFISVGGNEPPPLIDPNFDFLTGGTDDVPF